MSRLKNINMKNTPNGHGQNLNMKPGYLSDEALEELIAATEAEGMLRPPKGFRDDIISQVHRKRKYKKNLQLFSYSMKVIAATAASLGIVLIVPGNISTQEAQNSGFVVEWQEETGRIDTFMAEREKEYAKKIQEMEEKLQAERLREEKEKNQYAKKAQKADRGNFISQINNQMNEYVNIVNVKLNQAVRMEVELDEKEKE